MNIKDLIKEVKVPKGPIMSNIFSLQKELMVEYDKIERTNGYKIPFAPHSLDNDKVQARIKDMFWRTTEELAEAIEVLVAPVGLDRIPLSLRLNNWTEYWHSHSDVGHFFEELADATHFLTEASIISGIDVAVIDTLLNNLQDKPRAPLNQNSIYQTCSRVIFLMGSAANCLKNKPWKITQMPTDAFKFRTTVFSAWREFLELWHNLNCGSQELYLFYAKKNLVNQWRQKTNY